jgi:hypothetical protein
MGKIQCEEFEREVFLFVDGALSDKRVKLIENHLEGCDLCKSVLEDVKNASNAYDALPLDDIEESLYISMINNVIEGSSLPETDKKTLSPRGKSLVEMFGFYRLTFGGAAVAAAILLIIISFLREPRIEKSLPIDILDWHGDKITNSLEHIEDRILSLKSDEWDILIVRKNKKENWDATLRGIREKINKIKKSTNNKEL